MKEEALKLADESLNSEGLGYAEAWNLCIKQARMIRRLVEELDKWEKDLHLQSHVLGFMEGKAAQAEEHMMLQQPLSDEEIEQIAIRYYVGSRILPIQYARAIEERHGIK